MRRAALIALVEGFPVGIDFALEALGLVLGSGPPGWLSHPSSSAGRRLGPSGQLSRQLHRQQRSLGAAGKLQALQNAGDMELYGVGRRRERFGDLKIRLAFADQ